MNSFRKFCLMCFVFSTSFAFSQAASKDEEVKDAQEYIDSCMRWVPAWAKGMPLDCESGVAKSYGECEA